ncbi:MAG: endonuclease/exonuclease/phosphatase family protein [Nanoarchaeota archaeon]|nr:endonuclease/exonuclease/phosphatase family protein [Nanoarchaeota archaeon]
MRIKILHWNIWFKEDIANILEFINEINPDILCLQELTINSKYNPHKNLPQIIAEKLNYNFNFAQAHKFEDGHIQGNGIFSKYPIMDNLNFLITESKKSNDYSSEGRVCAVSQIKISNKEIIFATTHTSYSDAFMETNSRLEETEKLVQFFVNQKYLIFTGDLNLTPESKSIKLIENSLVHCGPAYSQPTWTTKPFSYKGFRADHLSWRLDYAFATNNIKILNSKILKTKYSDHLPILIEIEV